MQGISIGLLAIALLPVAPLKAQEAPLCYKLLILSAEWAATAAQPEPDHPLDLETPLKQVPTQFIVSDSLGRFGTQTTRPINGAISVFPHSVWGRQGDSLRVSWGTGYVGWMGRFVLSDSIASGESDGPWVGLLRRFWDNELAEPRGWWEYRSELHQRPCPSNPYGVS